MDLAGNIKYPSFLLFKTQQHHQQHLTEYSTLPESPFPSLSLSDLPLPAAPVLFALVGGVEHGYHEVEDDDDVGAACLVVRSAITTPV